MSASKRGKAALVIGAVLLAAALGLLLYNLWSDATAGKQADGALLTLSDRIEVNEKLIDPNRAMPTKHIGNWDYIGVLEIPSLELYLPVIDWWSYEALQMAPARYAGSAYADDMIIAAHNYHSHFGKLGQLSMGDAVLFTDVEGNVFDYRVQELELLRPEQVDALQAGDWDLTLFTCTWGGQSRLTVRCKRI